MATPAAIISTSSELRFSRRCYAAALGLTLLWGFVYVRYGNNGLCDEPGHLLVIHHYADGKPGWPETMTTPPGYHVTVDWLTPGRPTLASARVVTLGYALLAGAAFAGAWRQIHRAPAGAATLVLALLPILQPYTAMAYSDVPGLAVLLAAWWAQVSGRTPLAAGLLALASLTRQTNLVWGGFFIAWEAHRAFSQSDFRGRQALVQAWRQTRWTVLVLLAAAAIILITGKTTPGAMHGNALKPNIATLHVGALLVLLLSLPIWILYGPAAIRQQIALSRARFTVIWLTGGVLAAAALAVTFQNQHEWNRELFWPDASFTLLRNWPLVGIERHPWLRFISGFACVAALTALTLTFARQPQRRALWLTMPFAGALLFSNFLVEPRYFITPAAFLLVFLEMPRRAFWMMVIWFAVICAVHAPFIVLAKSLW